MQNVKYKAEQNRSITTCSDGNSVLLLSSGVLNSRLSLFGFISQTLHYLVRRDIISLW